MDCKQHHEHHEEEDDDGANVGRAGQVTDLVGGVHRGRMGGSCLRLLLLSVCVCVCACVCVGRGLHLLHLALKRFV